MNQLKMTLFGFFLLTSSSLALAAPPSIGVGHNVYASPVVDVSGVVNVPQNPVVSKPAISRMDLDDKTSSTLGKHMASDSVFASTMGPLNSEGKKVSSTAGYIVCEYPDGDPRLSKCYIRANAPGELECDNASADTQKTRGERAPSAGVNYSDRGVPSVGVSNGNSSRPSTGVPNR